MMKASKETTLERVPYIWYLIRFWKNQDDTQVILDSGSKVNVMNPAYTKKLGLYVR